ncbi:hypothetical protein [Frankia canadensis]|uniref:hypothetical protein n=1 Tax=Frankia canadensis TaxID=1836972 RepID=UPI001A9C837E|nr:hypothetical protein [Frankia canadensis]
MAEDQAVAADVTSAVDAAPAVDDVTPADGEKSVAKTRVSSTGTATPRSARPRTAKDRTKRGRTTGGTGKATERTGGATATLSVPAPRTATPDVGIASSPSAAGGGSAPASTGVRGDAGSHDTQAPTGPAVVDSDPVADQKTAPEQHSDPDEAERTHPAEPAQAEERAHPAEPAQTEERAHPAEPAQTEERAPATAPAQTEERDEQAEATADGEPGQAARPAPRRRGGHLRKPMRTVLLTMHVIVSVGWNGVAFAQLVLASTAAADDGLRHSAYELMHVVDRTLDIPLALLTLITGIVMSLKTRWGLLRYWWVVAKLSITVFAVISGGAVIRTLIVAAGHATAGGQTTYPAQAVALILCASVMNVLFITATVLSTAKPWGRTPRGRRDPALAMAPAG